MLRVYSLVMYVTNRYLIDCRELTQQYYMFIFNLLYTFYDELIKQCNL